MPPSEIPSGQFSIRTVLDAFAHSGLYQIHGGRGDLRLCRDLFDCSSIPLGSRPASMYPVGSTVLVYEPAGQPPIIIGALPSLIGEAKLALPDSLVLCSNVGAWQDALHSDPFRDPSREAVNYSNARPADSLPGDWGRINDLGLSFFLGRMMAFMRASDGAQVQAFWGDDLLRLVGYNLETFTSGTDERKINDQGEYQEVYRSSPFPWEAAGKGGARGATHTGDKKQPLGPGRVYSPVEPKEDDQLIVPRHMIVRGYLGDLEREFVCLPPKDLDISRYQNQDKYLGLMDISKHIDGSYSVRSAKQITLEKYVLLPVPKELIAPEDPLGDTDENYKFAGQHGNGDDHDMPEFEWEEDKPGIRAQQLWDYHAYFFGRYVQQGLVRHVKDWFLPEENQLGDMADRASIEPAVAKMGHTFYAELPSPQELKIDERNEHTAKFYATRSLIKQFDDGSVLIEGGFGEQIRMEGGNIFISCPGDVWQTPGRNAVTWAPHDVIQRAGNSADITAAKKDVRIKAERNLHILAANETIGSILVECRGNSMPSLDSFKDKLGEAVAGSGIFIKAPKTAVTVWGQRIYAGGSEKIRGKQIVFDAGEDGDVFLRGSRVDSLGKTSASLSTGEPGDTSSHVSLTPSALSVDAAQSVIGGPLALVGKDGRIANLQVTGTAFFSRSILLEDGLHTNGVISTETQEHLAPRKNKITIPKTTSQAAIVTQVKRAVDRSGDTKKELFFEGDDALGGVPMSQAVGFSCRRTKEDYKLEQNSFVIRSARWQTLIQSAGGGGTWDEPEVPYPDEDGGEITLPHPGKEAWQDWGKAFSLLSGGDNFDPASGVPVQRGQLKETGKALTESKLEGKYTINVQS